MDLKPKGGMVSHLGKMWTFVLYTMEPLAQGGIFAPPPRLRACVTPIFLLSSCATIFHRVGLNLSGPASKDTGLGLKV